MIVRCLGLPSSIACTAASSMSAIPARFWTGPSWRKSASAPLVLLGGDDPLDEPFAVLVGTSANVSR